MSRIGNMAAKAIAWMMFADLVLKIKWIKFKYRYIKR